MLNMCIKKYIILFRDHSNSFFFLLFKLFVLFPGHSLTQFVRHCADHFLNSEHKEIRMEAARTCSRLLTPSIHLISGHVVSQTAVQVVADVLSKLLVVGITDPGKLDGGSSTMWIYLTFLFFFF